MLKDSLQFETEVHLVNDQLSILEYYCGHFNRKMMFIFTHNWQFESWEHENDSVKISRIFWPKAPYVQILFLFSFFLAFFEPKIDKKKPRLKSYSLCQSLIRDSIHLFLFFPYSNKSENLCNNFDFLKINKTKKFGSKNSGLFCNLQAILIYMLPEAFISMLWKQIYFGR